MATKQVDTVRVTVNNTGLGPRGVNTTNGQVIVGRGETSKELVMSAGEFASIKDDKTLVIKELGAGDPVVRNEVEARQSKFGARLQSLEDRIARLEAGGSGKQAGHASGDDTKTVQEVLEMADDKDVPFATFKSAATKLLGDKTPSKKDEIIEALQATLK